MTSAYSITYLETIPSTNDEVLARIRAGSAAAGEVIAARMQSRARGRRGRRWIAEAGGLWFTVAMPLYGEHPGWAGMLAALAVCHALDEIGLRAGGKWPNDVVVGRRKLAGVLVEAVAGRGLAAVGIGLNVRNPLPAGDRDMSRNPRGPAPRFAPPPSQAQGGTGVSSTSGDASGAAAENGVLAPSAAVWPPTSVSRETGRDVDPQALLDPILARLSDLWRIWQAGSLAELHAAWSERDVCRGCRVRLLPDGTEGVAAGIDPTGALRVLLADGREKLALAGELAFLDSARE